MFGRVFTARRGSRIAAACAALLCVVVSAGSAMAQGDTPPAPPEYSIEISKPKDITHATENVSFQLVANVVPTNTATITFERTIGDTKVTLQRTSSTDSNRSSLDTIDVGRERSNGHSNSDGSLSISYRILSIDKGPGTISSTADSVTATIPATPQPTISGLSTNDAVVSERLVGSSRARISVSHAEKIPVGTAEAERTVDIFYGGDAIIGQDFTGPIKLVLREGQADSSFTIDITDDGEKEDVEELTVTIGGKSTTIEIFDNEAYDVTLSVDRASLPEGFDSGNGVLVNPAAQVEVTATLDRAYSSLAPNAGSSFHVVPLSSSTATVDVDYQISRGLGFEFLRGQKESTNKIPISAFLDTIDEPTETIVLRAAGVGSAEPLVNPKSPILTLEIQNAANGTLTLIKRINEVNARGGTFKFKLGGDVIGNYEIEATGTTATGFTGRVAIPVHAGGTVTVTELAQPGFTFNTVDCSNGKNFIHTEGKPEFTITVPSGENVECKITNDAGAVPGTLRLVKEIIGGEPTLPIPTFFFDLDGVDSSPVLLRPRKQPPSSGKTTYNTPPSDPIVVPAGTSITVRERAAAGYTPTRALCDFGDGAPQRDFTLSADKRSFEFVVPQAAEITCTVSNYVGTPPETVNLFLIKQIEGDAPRNGTFNFTVGPVAGAPSVTVPPLTTVKDEVDTPTGKVTVYESPPSDPIPVTVNTTITVTEAPTEGFTPTSARCTFADADAPEIIQLSAQKRSFEIDVLPGGNITCTVTNRVDQEKQIQLSLIKVINGEPDNLRNGTFTFDITGGDKPEQSITLTTETDATLELNFQSPKQEKIRRPRGVITITEKDPSRLGFAIGTNAACSFDGGQPEEFPIDAKTRTFSIDATNAEAVECTVPNTALKRQQPGSLSLIKQINEGPNGEPGRGGTFSFELTGAATDTIERTAVAAPRGGFASPPSELVSVPAGGTVTVTEAASPGFTPNVALCSVAGGGTTQHKLSATDRDFDVTINAGEAVECIIVNNVDARPTPEPEPAAPTLTVETISNGGTSTFTFTGSDGAPFDTLPLRTTRKGVAVASDVMKATAGPATITQAETRGFTFVSASCRLGETALGTPNEETRSIALEMPATGDVVCTFVNRGQSARTATIIWNFLKRRAEALTGDTGRSRLIERRQDAGRYASGGLKDAVGVSGEGSDRQGRLGVRTSLSKLGGALGDDPASVKASRLGVNASNYGVSDGAGYRSGWDIWTEANWNYRRSDGGRAGGTESSGQFGLIRGGVDYLVSPNMLVGVLVQYDYLSDESKARGRDGYDISGHGWMAGPYVEVALSKNLIFDGKALWGTSRNTVSPDLTFTDSFTTERWLASARLTGSWTWAQSATSSWHFAPKAEVVWFDEKSAGFTNALGVDINSQHVRLGRFKAGPEFSYRHRMANGTVVEPRVGAQALWRFTGAGNANAPDLDTASSDALADVPLEKFQMRFEGGLKVETAQGTRIELEGAYTGLGRQGQDTIGGKVGVTIPLQ